MKNISRNTKLAKALSLVDDKYIAEADPAAKKLPLKTKRPRPRLLAACLCGAILLLGLWAFIPYDTTPASVAKHSSSEYYEIIQLLNEATFKAYFEQTKITADKAIVSLYEGEKTVVVVYDVTSGRDKFTLNAPGFSKVTDLLNGGTYELKDGKAVLPARVRELQMYLLS